MKGFVNDGFKMYFFGRTQDVFPDPTRFFLPFGEGGQAFSMLNGNVCLRL